MTKPNSIIMTVALIATVSISALSYVPFTDSPVVDNTGISDTRIISTAADISGKWNLAADADGQAVDLEVVLKQEEAAFSGTVSTPYGDGTIEEGKVTDNDFTATIKIEIQGQPMELTFAGKLEDSQLKGTIEGDGIPEVSFVGTKVKTEEG